MYEQSGYLNHQIPFTNKKKSAGHSASPVGYFNYTCMALQKKRSICISNNTLLKPDEVILDLFQKIKGLGILCGEIEQDFFPCNFLYRATVLLILGGTVSLS